jgi:integrase
MQVQCLSMMNFTELPSVPSDHLVPFTDQLRLAVAAYLARVKGSSRYHTESDLRCYLAWCAEHGMEPLAARRPHLELYIRWMQEIRRVKVVLIPLPPAVGRAIDTAIGIRASGPVLLNSRGARMDRHAATRRLRRLRRLAETAGVPIIRPDPHMLRHAFVSTMLDAGVDLRDVQIAARHADPRTTMRYDRARKNLDRHPNYILAAYMASGT